MVTAVRSLLTKDNKLEKFDFASFIFITVGIKHPFSRTPLLYQILDNKGKNDSMHQARTDFLYSLRDIPVADLNARRSSESSE